MSTRDGGPAFPSEAVFDTDRPSAPGMTLRDYFAAQAIVAIMPGLKLSSGALASELMRTAAAAAYMAADAMLAERAVK